METRILRDSGWVGSMFFNTPINARDRRFNSLKIFSNSMLSFGDTTLGGNQAINAPPQFTLFADPPMLGAFASPVVAGRQDQSEWLSKFESRGSYRMGQFYWEAIDDNAHYAHIRFGKPKYIGMAAFFANMYDSKVAYLARTGDYPGLIRVSAMYVTAAAICAAVGPVAFVAILVTPKIIGALINAPTSRYWYLKPTMHLYLRTVQTMVNTQLVHRRLTHTGLFGVLKKGGDIDDEANRYNADKKEFYEALPEVWREKGIFDIYRMVNRYQTLMNYQHEMLKMYEDKYMKENNPDGLDAELINFYRTATYSTLVQDDARDKKGYGLEEMEIMFSKSLGYRGSEDEDSLNDYLLDKAESIYSQAGESGGTADDYTKANLDQQEQLKLEMEQRRRQAQEMDSEGQPIDDAEIQAYMDGGQKRTFGDIFGEFANMAKDTIEDLKLSITKDAFDEMTQGSQWVTWKIDAKDTISRSWSNSTKEPEVSSMVNSVTQKARSLDVNLSGGTTGISGVDAVVTGVKSALTGALDFLHLSGIVSLYNQSVINFPEVWDNSDMTGDDLTINIPLRCWSGNDLDVFQDLIVPLCFWIAAACPIATGKQSHTHPFYCEVYSRGRISIANGMVTNMSVQFGTGGLGWRSDGLPLAADISVTIRDLNRRMFMPVVTDQSAWDEDNKFSELMSVLGAATLQERTNGISMSAINLATWKNSYLSSWSVSSITNKLGELPGARTLSNIITARSY